MEIVDMAMLTFWILLPKTWIFKFPPKMTAATTAAAASQELSQSGKSLDPSRAGTKYPVQESLTSIIQQTVPTSDSLFAGEGEREADRDPVSSFMGQLYVHRLACM